MQTQGIQFMRYGEDDMKISGGQELVLLLNDPHLLVQALALGAMSVTTRIVADSEMTALFTGVNVTAQGRGTASADGCERPPVMRRKPAGWQLMLKLFDDLGQVETRFHPRSMNWSRVDCCFWGGILAYFR